MKKEDGKFLLKIITLIILLFKIMFIFYVGIGLEILGKPFINIPGKEYCM